MIAIVNALMMNFINDSNSVKKVTKERRVY